MAQQLLNLGTTTDDGTGDTLRNAGIKINSNFSELYSIAVPDQVGNGGVDRKSVV